MPPKHAHRRHMKPIPMAISRSLTAGVSLQVPETRLRGCARARGGRSTQAHVQITALPGWLCLCVCMARASQGLVGEASTAGFVTKTRVKNPQFREYWEILKKSRIRVLEILTD